MKNLVMTICMNYSYEIYERFIGSLFDSVNDNSVELLIFIGSNDEQYIQKFININKDNINQNNINQNNIKYKVIDNKNVHVVNYRFKLYYDYLIENKDIYNLIFICDSRDVLFQKNIFTHPIINNKYDLYIFEEETLDITIDKCRFNSLYIKKSGLNIENLVKDKSILCVGTILGTTHGILKYLEKFNYILFNIVNEENRSYYGTDSGINYYIIYGNLLNNINLCVCKNNNKLVYTLAFPNYLNLIDYNTLLNEKKQICYANDVCYCIHQYDRLDDNIKKQISIKYNYEI